MTKWKFGPPKIIFLKLCALPPLPRHIGELSLNDKHVVDFS